MSNGRQSPSPANLYLNVFNDSGGLFSGEFIGNRPPWSFSRITNLILIFTTINLYYNPINPIIFFIFTFHPVFPKLKNFFNIFALFIKITNLETQISEKL